MFNLVIFCIKVTVWSCIPHKSYVIFLFYSHKYWCHHSEVGNLIWNCLIGPSGNLGTWFPRNPWTSGEIFVRSHDFLMIYTRERNEVKWFAVVGNVFLFKIHYFLSNEMFNVQENELLSKLMDSCQRKWLSVKGNGFLSKETVSCHKKRVYVKGNDFMSKKMIVSSQNKYFPV